MRDNPDEKATYLISVVLNNNNVAEHNENMFIIDYYLSCSYSDVKNWFNTPISIYWH